MTLWKHFVCFLCLRLFSIFSIRPLDVFDPVKCKTWFLFWDYLSLLFIDTTLNVLHYFSFLKLSPSLLSWPKPLRVFESSFVRLVVFSCLYYSWSIFYPRLKWLIGSSQSSPYFAANIVKSSDYSAYQLHFVSPSLKLFYIWKEAVWFWEQSDLSLKIPSLCWKYSLLLFWNKFETNVFRIDAYLSLTHSESTSS